MPTPDQTGSPFRAAGSLPLDRRFGGKITAYDQLPIHALGNQYVVEGSGTVTSLPALPMGETVFLQMAGTPTFANSAKLICPNSTNYTAVAGDLVITRSKGDGVWQVYVLPNDAEFPRTSTAQSLNDTQKAQGRANLGVEKKNYIINGAMMASQENGATAVTADATYPVDMFAIRKSTAGTAAFNAAQVASLTPGGSPNRLRVTVTAAQTSVGVSDFIHLQHRMEGCRIADLKFGNAAAKSVILQFGVKAPAGTYCAVLINSAGNRSYVAEYTIAAGEANTDVVKSITLSGDAIGTWSTDNTLGIDIRFGLMAGSSVQQTAGSWGTGNVRGSSNQFNLFGTNANVFELFDVGLYEGNAAPAFIVPDFQKELAECQRYWEKSYDYGTAPGTATTVGLVFCGTNISSNDAAGVRFQIPKRASPTMSWWEGSGTSNFVTTALAGTYSNARGGITALTNGIGTQGANFLTGLSGAGASGVVVFVHFKADARL
jgi:predicted methyltransferase